MALSTSNYGELVDVTTNMFAEAFNFEWEWSNYLLKSALRVPAMLEAPTGVKFERMIAEHDSLKPASLWLATNWSSSLTVSGRDTIPSEGPLLLVSNHPGMGDAISLYATLPREDILTLVKVRTLLTALPNFVSRCIVMEEDKPVAALRQVIKKLRKGSTVLLFARGEMEVDPRIDIYQAISSLDQWSPSIETIAKAVPGLTVVPVAIGGVISESAYKAPVSRLYKNMDSRNYMAATLQLMFKHYRDINVRVAYGKPLRDGDIRLSRVQSEMARLLGSVL